MTVDGSFAYQYEQEKKTCSHRWKVYSFRERSKERVIKLMTVRRSDAKNDCTYGTCSFKIVK